MTDVPAYVPLVRVLRGEYLESVHYGAVTFADATGKLLRSAGDPSAVSFMRSSAKPFQVIPVIESGAADRFGLTPSELAVAIASHNAEDFHQAAVRSILDKIGLSEDHLKCGTHEPGHAATAHGLREAGLQPTPIHSNCSGKHAAMLALAVHRGYPTEGYTRLDHPVQAEMISAMSSFSGIPVPEIALAVDGCTVPTFGLPLHSAAAAYARLLEPDAFDRPRREAARRVVEAMRAHPEMVGGEGVIDTDLMRLASAGLIAKRGAEGFYGIGFLREGRGHAVAFKIADGDTGRARNAVVIELVRQLSLASPRALHELAEQYLPPIFNRRGMLVGRTEAHLKIS